MEVAHGTVVIDLDDTAAISRMRALQAEISRELAKIDGKEAELQIDANTKEFYAKVRKAQADLERWEHEKATAELDVDVRRANAGIANAKRRLQDYEKQNVKTYNKINDLDRQRSVVAAREESKRASVVESFLSKRERQEAQQHRASLARERELSRERVSSAKAAEKARMAPAKFAQEEAQVARMRKQYANLGRELDKLDRQSGRLRIRAQPAVHQRVELDKARAIAEMLSLKAQLEALGHEPPVDIEVGVDAQQAGAIGRMLDAIATTTVRVGPFTTTIIGLGRALALIGPIVVGLIGQFGALAAVVGAAAIGAFGVASAAAVGFIGAAAGIFFVVKPMVKQFQEVKKATDALHVAQLKYGDSSEQVRKAQSRLAHVLKGVNPNVRKQIEELPKLTGRWKDLTAAARPEVWRVIGSGVQTVSALMPMFARNTVQATRAVGRGVREWMQGLRSTEGRDVLGDIFGGFTKSIPNIMHGLGQLGAAFGRFMAPFARLMPSLTGGFDRWADGISNASKNASKMEAIAKRTVAAMQALGHVTAAAGRVIGAFVTAGTGPGTEMLESWAKGLNNLAASMNSVAGQRGLSQFFTDSIDTANKFWGALKPIGQLFFEWTTVLRPFTDAGLQVVRVLAQITQALASIGPVKTALQIAFGGALLLGFTRRAREAIVAIRGLATALVGLRVAQAATGGAAGASGLGAVLGGGAAAAGAGKATREVGLLRAAATKLVPAIAGMGAIAGGAATLGLTALAAAAVYGVYKLVTMKSESEKLHDQLKKVAEQSQEATDVTIKYNDATSQAAVASRDYERTVGSVAKLKKRLSDLDAEGKKNTDEYRNATDRLRQALVQRGVNEENARKLGAKSIALGGQVIASNRARLNATKALNDAQDNLSLAERHADAQKLTGALRDRALADERRDVADATRAAAAADKAAEQNQNRLAASNANVQRALKGMIPLTEQATQSIGRLARSRPAAAVKIATKFEDPKDAGRVAQAAQRTLGKGVSIKTVMKIVADSRSADQAVDRLKAIRLDTKTLNIIERGGSAAVAKVQQIIGKKIPTKDAKIIERGGDAALAKVAEIIARKIPGKNFNINARDNASGKISAIAAMIGALRDKTITITTRMITTGKIAPGARRGPVPGAASGHSAGRSMTALVGEGGGPEMLANRASGLVSVVRSPMFAALGSDDYVIPTEAKHRGKGRDLFAQFARDMGIPGFKGGKKPQKALSENAKAKARGSARKKVPAFHAYSSDDIAELPGVEKAKQREEDQNREISIYQSTMKEPESFIKPVGEDGQGNPIYAVDQAAISNWSGQLNQLASMYDTLVVRIQEVQAAVNKALKAVHKVINRATRNIATLNELAERQRKIISGKGKSRHERERAKERLGVYTDAIDKEKESRKNAQSDEKSLDEDRHDAPFRIREAQIAASEARSDATGIQGIAEKDVASSNPKAQDAAVADPFEAGNLGVSRFEAEKALAEAGIGWMGAPVRDLGAINADIIAANKSIIGTAQAMLTDTDVTNDAAAYSAIQGAGGAIAGILGQQANIPNEQFISGGLRGDLYKSFGSNALVSGALAPSYATPGTVGTSPTGQYPAGGTGNIINVTNNYQTQPTDPHTWSRNLMFELQAAS